MTGFDIFEIEYTVCCFPTRMPKQLAGSPLSSSMSMKSDWSMDPPLNFKEGNLSVDKR